MTESPQPQYGDDTASEPRAVSLGAVIAWLAIAASVATLLLTRGEPEPSVAAGEKSVWKIDFQTRMLGRYAVGVKQIAPDSAPVVLREFRKALKSKADHVRAATVTAEVEGADSALSELRDIELSQDDEHERELARDVETLQTIYALPRASNSALDAQVQRELIDRHGWFADLAFSWGEPTGSGLRERAIAPARRTAMTLLTMLFGALVLLICGIVACVSVIVLISTGLARRSYAPSAASAGPFVEAFAIYIVLLVFGSLLASRFEGSAQGSAIRIGVLCAPIAALWPLARGIRWRDLRVGLGWHPGRGLFSEIGAGVLGYLAGVPLVTIGIFLTFWITKFTGAQPTHPIIEQISADPLRVFMLLMLASVYAPIVEETMFRGALYHHVRRRIAWPLATIIVALIFAGIHPQGLAAIPALASLAIVFAIIREWRGSLVGPIVAHAMNNAILVIVMTMLLG